METTNPTEQLGYKNIIENFFVFFIFGAIMISYGNFALDLTEDLPDQYIEIIQDPLSIYTFGFLSIFSLCFIAILSLFNGESFIKSSRFNKWFLPFSRVGLSTGAIVFGVLLGAGTCLWIFSLSFGETSLTFYAIKYLKLSAFVLLFIIAIIILHLYLLYPWKKKNLLLDIASVLYCGIVVLSIWRLDLSAQNKAVGIQSILLIIFAICIKKTGVKKHNKSLHRTEGKDFS